MPEGDDKLLMLPRLGRRPRRSPAVYWLLDWPVFIVRSAVALYWTLIGVLGALLILSTAAILILWFFFGIRWGW